MVASGILGDKDRARADRDATDWLILLQDEPDNAEIRERFDAWHSVGPVNAAAWAEIQYVTDVIDGTSPAHSSYWTDLPDAAPFTQTTPPALIQAKRPEHSRRVVKRQTHQRGIRKKILVAAAAACLAIIAAPDLILQMQADHVTSTGEVRTVQLEDGSTVRLGAASAIEVAYKSGERRVRLLKGQAYFEVKRDPDHPFRVAVRSVETTVLGTGFEVRLKDNGADVAVRHGLVRVDYQSGASPLSERLVAGEQISITWAGMGERGHVRPEKVAAWTNGQLIVSDRPVSEVIDALRPWYSGLIIATGEKLDTERVTGVYDLHDPAAALQALGHAHHTSVQRISPWIMLISSN